MKPERKGQKVQSSTDGMEKEYNYNDKKYIAMESLEKYLINKEIGIIKLLDPPFEKSKLEPGYIKAYIKD